MGECNNKQPNMWHAALLCVWCVQIILPARAWAKSATSPRATLWWRATSSTASVWAGRVRAFRSRCARVPATPASQGRERVYMCVYVCNTCVPGQVYPVSDPDSGPAFAMPLALMVARWPALLRCSGAVLLPGGSQVDQANYFLTYNGWCSRVLVRVARRTLLPSKLRSQRLERFRAATHSAHLRAQAADATDEEFRHCLARTVGAMHVYARHQLRGAVHRRSLCAIAAGSSPRSPSRSAASPASAPGWATPSGTRTWPAPPAWSAPGSARSASR